LFLFTANQCRPAGLRIAFIFTIYKTWKVYRLSKSYGFWLEPDELLSHKIVNFVANLYI
jgi:hypothetical protein